MLTVYIDIGNVIEMGIALINIFEFFCLFLITSKQYFLIVTENLNNSVRREPASTEIGD